jgi:hypothetical protein
MRHDARMGAAYARLSSTQTIIDASSEVLSRLLALPILM